MQKYTCPDTRVPFCVVKYCVFGAGWGPGCRIYSKTLCSCRLGWGLDAQFIVTDCVFFVPGWGPGCTFWRYLL
jgi:hypothetical protein